MILVDVNVLLAAHNSGHPHHEPARRWLDAALSGAEPVVVPDLAWVGFMRLTTNRRVFETPATTAEAAEFVRAVTASPAYRPLAGHPGGIEPVLAFLVDGGVVASLVTDAYLASIAVALAARVATFDRDFTRFAGVVVLTPGADGAAAPDRP